MIELQGNIWSHCLSSGDRIVIPTNGFVKSNGSAVMGRGLAQQASRHFPHLPYLLGRAIKEHGNVTLEFTVPPLFTFPVKHNWWEKADIELIRTSAAGLKELVSVRDITVYLPRVGCGNGQLDWGNVKPVLQSILDDERFVIIDLVGG